MISSIVFEGSFEQAAAIKALLFFAENIKKYKNIKIQKTEASNRTIFM